MCSSRFSWYGCTVTIANITGFHCGVVTHEQKVEHTRLYSDCASFSFRLFFFFFFLRGAGGGGGSWTCVPYIYAIMLALYL